MPKWNSSRLKGGLPESFWESFSAFANTNGGIIVLGAKEKNGVFSFDGLTKEQITTYKKRFWDCAHNKEKVSATMLTERDVVEGKTEEGHYLAFRVPRAAYDIRPVYLTPNPIGNTYKRNHKGDYHCTDAEVREMFADAHHATKPFDNNILTNYSWDDIDMATFRAYRQRFFSRKETHPWNDLDDLTFLIKIGGYRIDRETGTEGFTRAGILMLGKTESITDEACTPWYFPDYQEKLSDSADVRWSNRIYPDGTWEANIYQFFFRVYNQLSQTIPTPFKLEGVVRTDETPAHVAIREALVNLLVHSSYAEQGNIVVIRELDKITMRNPGRMLISVEDFYAGGHSLCRNPVIQKMFMLLGYGEKAGSGADYIVKGWEENQWARPQIEERVQPDTVCLTLELESEVVDNAPGANTEQTKNEGDLSPAVPSCPQLVPSLSPVCPQLKQEYLEKAAKVVLALKDGDKAISTLMVIAKEKNKNRFRQQVLSPLMEGGVIEQTIKDVPNSPKQKYHLIEK